MFTVSWNELAGLTTIIVLACTAVIFPVDRPNDRANWPIPVASFMWV